MSRLTPTQRQMYRDFCECFTSCWCCEVEPLPQVFYDSPNWKWFTSTLECHHIIGGASRRADRRCIVRLCKVHHRAYHGQRYRPTRNTPLPRVLTLGNMVWLKQMFDPHYLHLEFLQSLQTKHNLPIVPEPINGVKRGIAS